MMISQPTTWSTGKWLLLTGGTGKTSIRLARFLQNANIPFLLASRRGFAAAPPGMQLVRQIYLGATISVSVCGKRKYIGDLSHGAVGAGAMEVPD
jgi:hypothetical protein